MNKNTVITLLFILIVGFCNAFELKPNQWTDFEGTLGTTRIQLSLFLFEDGKVKGNYCYKKFDTKIHFVGEIVDRKSITLSSIDDKKAPETFKGQFFTNEADRFEGTWTNSDGSTFPFKLTLQSIVGSNFDSRYTDFFGSDTEVENFMKKVKKASLTNDKKWMANHVYYPLKTTLNGKKTIIIRNKEQFISNFEKIFHPDFKTQIKNSCTCNMFNNYLGATLNNGSIWINNSANSTKLKYDFVISALNN
jgi:hypothetical protein